MEWLRQQAGFYRLLDVGAGNGALVEEALASGFYATGIEMSRFMVQHVFRRYGIALIEGDWRLLQIDFDAPKWDVITACDVIEHLLEPEAALRVMLKRARFVYLETPDYPGGDWREWEWKKHVRPRQHPCLFSEHALHRIAESAGATVRRIHRPIPGKLALLLSAG